MRMDTRLRWQSGRSIDTSALLSTSSFWPSLEERTHSCMQTRGHISLTSHADYLQSCWVWALQLGMWTRRSIQRIQGRANQHNSKAEKDKTQTHTAHSRDGYLSFQKVWGPVKLQRCPSNAVGYFPLLTLTNWKEPLSCMLHSTGGSQYRKILTPGTTQACTVILFIAMRNYVWSQTKMSCCLHHQNTVIFLLLSPTTILSPWTLNAAPNIKHYQLLSKSSGLKRSRTWSPESALKNWKEYNVISDTETTVRLFGWMMEGTSLWLWFWRSPSHLNTEEMLLGE